MLMKSALLSFFIFTLIAWNTSQEVNAKPASDTSTAKPNTQKQIINNLKPAFGCHYKLDDKYSDNTDATEIDKWWSEKLIEFETHGLGDHICSGSSVSGGGPNGAQWNPSTDIFFAASVGYILTDENFELKLNKKRLSGVKFFKYFPTQKTGAIVYFVLKRKIWEKNLRRIKTSDYTKVYGKDYKKQYHFVAPFNSGEVVEITFKIKGARAPFIVFHDYILAAYGE